MEVALEVTPDGRFKVWFKINAVLFAFHNQGSVNALSTHEQSRFVSVFLRCPGTSLPSPAPDGGLLSLLLESRSNRQVDGA